MNEPIASELEESDASYEVTHNPNPTQTPEPSSAPTSAGTIAGTVDTDEDHSDDHSGHDHAGQDHAGHDHAGHDHAGHDHAGHDHSGHDTASHDHSGHDHAGHDHSGHDHNHDTATHHSPPSAPVDTGSPDGEDSDVDMDALTETLEYIRPALQADGGDLVLLGVKGGTVNLQLVGACGGCPMSTMTLKQGIERIIFDRVPGATEVVAI